MQALLLVGLGGFIGAGLRYGVGQLVARHVAHPFPLATLGVNVLGCLLIGALMAWSLDRESFTLEARLFLVVGVLGSFTTFSTFGYETILLVEAGNFRDAALNAALNLLAGGAAVWLGLAAGRGLFSKVG